MMSDARPLLAINETEGVAILLERVLSYVYNSFPDARQFIAESIEWHDENQVKVWERQDTDLPDNLTEEQARFSIDRLRSMWRDGNFPKPPAFESMAEYSLSVLSMAVAEVAAAIQPPKTRDTIMEALRQKMTLFTQDPDVPEALSSAARENFDTIAELMRRVIAEKRQPRSP